MTYRIHNFETNKILSVPLSSVEDGRSRGASVVERGLLASCRKIYLHYPD